MMSEAHRVLSLRSRQKSAKEAEPLYSALNTVNVLLGNVLVRKAIHSLCVDDTQAIYKALTYYSGRSDLNLLKKLKLLPICAFVELGRMSFHVDKSTMQGYFSQQVTRRGLSNIVKSIAGRDQQAPQTSGALFGRLELHGCVQSALQALLPRCRQNVK